MGIAFLLLFCVSIQVFELHFRTQELKATKNISTRENAKKKCVMTNMCV